MEAYVQYVIQHCEQKEVEAWVRTCVQLSKAMQEVVKSALGERSFLPSDDEKTLLFLYGALPDFHEVRVSIEVSPPPPPLSNHKTYCIEVPEPIAAPCASHTSAAYAFNFALKCLWRPCGEIPYNGSKPFMRARIDFKTLEKYRAKSDDWMLSFIPSKCKPGEFTFLFSTGAPYFFVWALGQAGYKKFFPDLRKLFANFSKCQVRLLCRFYPCRWTEAFALFSGGKEVFLFFML